MEVNIICTCTSHCLATERKLSKGGGRNSCMFSQDPISNLPASGLD